MRCRRRQAGAFVILFPFVLIALFGLVGLTLTSGNTFADRAKLQNLLDAIALSVAATVNTLNAKNLPNPEDKCRAEHASASGVGAVQAALNAFAYGTAFPANRPLRGALEQSGTEVPGGDVPGVIIEYATRLTPEAFSAECPQTDSSQPIYVRIRLSQPIQTPEFMIQVLGPWLGGQTYDVRVSGSAVAGPAPAMPHWNPRRCPLSAFLCDRSLAGDALHPPAADCEESPNGAGCGYGYPRNRLCEIPVQGSTSQPSVCSELEAMAAAQSLQMVAGFDVDQSLSGVEGACPQGPDANGLVAVVPGTLSPAGLSRGLANRLPADPPGVLAPVLDCASNLGSKAIVGYLCLQLEAGDSPDQIRLQAVESALMPGNCGASPRLAGPGSLPREPGLRPPLWRMVLYKDPGARDS